MSIYFRLVIFTSRRPAPISGVATLKTVRLSAAVEGLNRPNASVQLPGNQQSRGLTIGR